MREDENVTMETTTVLEVAGGDMQCPIEHPQGRREWQGFGKHIIFIPNCPTKGIILYNI